MEHFKNELLKEFQEMQLQTFANFQSKIDTFFQVSQISVARDGSENGALSPHAGFVQHTPTPPGSIATPFETPKRKNVIRSPMTTKRCEIVLKNRFNGLKFEDPENERKEAVDQEWPSVRPEIRRQPVALQQPHRHPLLRTHPSSSPATVQQQQPSVQQSAQASVRPQQPLRQTAPVCVQQPQPSAQQNAQASVHPEQPLRQTAPVSIQQPQPSAQQTASASFHPQQPSLQHASPQTVPGNSLYSSKVKNGRKVILYGDSHLNRISGREMKKFTPNTLPIVRAFPGATAEHLLHYVQPTLIEERPDSVVIHIGTNNVTKRKMTSPADLARKIVDIGEYCRVTGVSDIFISSVLITDNFRHRKLIREVNNILRALCAERNFTFIDNDFITEEYLFLDGIHLINEGRNILANNIIYGLNFTHRRSPVAPRTR